MEHVVRPVADVVVGVAVAGDVHQPVEGLGRAWDLSDARSHRRTPPPTPVSRACRCRGTAARGSSTRRPPGRARGHEVGQPHGRRTGSAVGQADHVGGRPKRGIAHVARPLADAVRQVFEQAGRGEVAVRRALGQDHPVGPVSLPGGDTAA